MHTDRATGAIGSQPDYRDGYAMLASAINVADTIVIPKTKDPEPMGPVQDQNQIPACVSHSIVYLMRAYWHRRTGKWIDFSPRFLDILSAESWIPLEGGRVPRTVLKRALQYGCCTTAMLPNDTSLSIAEYRDKSVLTQAMLDEAKQYRIPGFVNIPEGKEKQAIHLYGAITGLFAVGKEMYTDKNGNGSWKAKDISPLRQPAAIISGHEMTPNGYGVQYIDVLNEWSIDWANKGSAEYDPSVWRKFFYESWAIAEIPEDLALFLSQLPSPSDIHYEWDENIEFGAFNEDVRWLQIALMSLGHLAPVPADQLGWFGSKTAAAVVKYQTVKKIKPVIPVRVGPQTRKALNADFVG